MVQEPEEGQKEEVERNGTIHNPTSHLPQKQKVDDAVKVLLPLYFPRGNRKGVKTDGVTILIGLNGAASKVMLVLDRTSYKPAIFRSNFRWRPRNEEEWTSPSKDMWTHTKAIRLWSLQPPKQIIAIQTNNAIVRCFTPATVAQSARLSTHMWYVSSRFRDCQCCEVLMTTNLIKISNPEKLLMNYSMKQEFGDLQN